MKKVTLEIETSYERKSVALEEELSVGRTGEAQLIIGDAGLSRVNTTFFRDDDDVLIADENSLNGTFLNGERITGRPRVLSDGDEIRIGSDTLIRVLIEEDFGAETRKREEDFNENRSFAASGFGEEGASLYNAEGEKRQNSFSTQQNPQSAIQNPESGKPPFILIAGVVSTFIIIFLGIAAYFIASQYEKNQTAGKNQKTQQTVVKSQTIPVRVVDPLGGEDEEDLDDLIASWEVAEEEINAATVADVTVAADASAEETELNVTAAFLAEQQSKAFAARNGETGIRPAGLNVPKELFGDGVIKQKAKLREMNTTGYKQPLDFAELAEKRLSRELIEMPMATKSFYLDVGGSAKDSPFTAFSFQTGNTEITPGTPKWNTLAQLASNFAGTKYDLNNPAHRKQMRMRLLRMFNQRAKPLLKELADAYHAKFNRPLRVTSLTRSMDYQISLNATNANSFKVRGEGSLPPHTSGCAFDLSRKHMTADEQNFVMQKLAEMEQRGVLDALIEYGTNACFHVFIYADGAPPRM
jgi:pSer/pThr/pTyr-binding forkhead associated (FHA) protein